MILCDIIPQHSYHWAGCRDTAYVAGGCEGQAKLHADDLGYQSPQEFQCLEASVKRLEVGKMVVLFR